MFAKELRRKLDSDELMPFPGPARRRQRRLTLVIEREHPRLQWNAPLTLGQSSVPREIQAKLNAAWVKAARPIQFPGGLEIMPLETETQLAEIAEERPPARANGIPGLR